MMNPDRDSSKQCISTLIFMDLETTGLPRHVGRRNVHITELSFVAVDRDDFKTDGSLRVLNKLTMCVRPRSDISPSAMHVTGLYSDMLQNQQEFNDTIASVLNNFLCRLRPPLCLLAHNGNKFDFPILQAELKRLKHSLHPAILCADTLIAFRNICSNVSPKLVQTRISDYLAQLKISGLNSNLPLVEKEDSALTDEEIDHLLSEDMECFNKVKEEDITSSIKIDDEDIQYITDVSKEDMKCFSNVTEEDMKCFANVSKEDIKYFTKISEEDMKCFNNVVEEQMKSFSNITGAEIKENITNSSLECKSFQGQNVSKELFRFENEHTPHTKFQVNFDLKSNVGPIRKQHKYRQTNYIYSKNEHGKISKTDTFPAKRKLFLSNEVSSTAYKPARHNNPHSMGSIVHFSLNRLYYHFFKKNPPQSHTAEADSINLSKICQKINKDFLKWIDENSVFFSEIEALW